MRLVKAFWVGAVVFALVAYVVDCSAMATPDEAMQCCDTMPCSSHSHGQAQDCCKAMSSTHVPFVRPSSSQDTPHVPLVFAILSSLDKVSALVSSADLIQQESHAPPILLSPASLPLRI